MFVQPLPLPPPPNSEPAALPDLPGTPLKTVVFPLRVEKVNSTVLLKTNVSLEEQPVAQQSVTMTVPVVETRAVSVETVSTDDEMTRTSVAS